MNTLGLNYSLPFMGLIAGTQWKFALIGFLITGIGMPLLGIMAAARAGGTVEHLGSSQPRQALQPDWSQSLSGWTA